MDEIHKTYSLALEDSNKHLAVQAIGFHAGCHKQVFKLMVPAYRIILFHQAMQLNWNKREIITEPNTLFIFPRYSSVTYTSLTSSYWDHSWIRLAGNAVAGLIQDANLPFDQPINFGDSQENDKWLPLILEEMENPQPNYHIIENLVKIWLQIIKKQAGGSDKNIVPEPFMKTKQYLDNNYLKDIKLKALAHHACLSPAYLCDGFKRHYQVSPIDYAVRLRLNHAILLLEDHTIPISEIAHQSGFNDIYYFSKLFKKRLGCSPSQYRKK